MPTKHNLSRRAVDAKVRVARHHQVRTSVMADLDVYSVDSRAEASWSELCAEMARDMNGRR